MVFVVDLATTKQVATYIRMVDVVVLLNTVIAFECSEIYYQHDRSSSSILTLLYAGQHKQSTFLLRCVFCWQGILKKWGESSSM